MLGATYALRPKAFARYLYATIPGLAVLRFAAKDLISPYIAKPEYYGVRHLAIGERLIVDIGANRGQSVAAFRRMAPQSSLVAFEPDPSCFARLKMRSFSGSRIAIYPCALGADAGEITFYVPKYGFWNCDGMSATDYSSATLWLEDPGRMLHFDPGKLSVSRHVVQRETLDKFALAPALIKVHAQGAEYDILRGARDTIKAHRPALMIAFVTNSVLALLREWEYSPFDYRGSRFIPKLAERPRTFTWFLSEAHIARLSVQAL